MKIIDYFLLTSWKGFASFPGEVKKAMNEGWQPIGGVSVNFDSGISSVCCVQAMVKYAPETPVQLPAAPTLPEWKYNPPTSPTMPSWTPAPSQPFPSHTFFCSNGI